MIIHLDNIILTNEIGFVKMNPGWTFPLTRSRMDRFNTSGNISENTNKERKNTYAF